MHTELSNPAEVPNSANPTNPVIGPTHRQHLFGISLVLSVACIWVISGELIQSIFKEPNADAPFLLTYYSISLFSICLLGFLRYSWRAAFHSAFYQPLTNPTSSSSITSSEQPLTHAPPGYRAIRLAAILAPLFFLSNWTFNVGLDKTSVASSSTIATLTTLFTLVFGALLGVERFSYVKLIAIALVMGGVALITGNDKRQAGPSHLTGDFFTILSSAIYSLYTIILKKESGRHGDISMLMMLAFLGFFTAVSAWPGFFILHFANVERFQLPNWKTFAMLTINGLIGTVLSDFLWATGVVLTTPLIGTLSLSLSVPLSIIADLILQRESFNWVYLAGAGLVFVGFIMVNMSEALAREKITTEEGLETFQDRVENGLQLRLQETGVR